MARHTHEFVNTYEGLVGFGMDRETDEATVQVYLQKFSDDAILQRILPRMSDKELEEIFNFVNAVMRRHFKEEEYHELFLQDRDPS
ncbi:MAG: hypothetical protein ACLFTB_00295 [Desulfovibrionales bacterium]